MLTRRSLLASLLALVPGFAWAMRSRASMLSPSEALWLEQARGRVCGGIVRKDPHDEPMTLLGVECHDMGLGQFILHRRFAHVTGAQVPAQVLVVLRFRTDDGLPFIHWFTLPEERITLTKMEWANVINSAGAGIADQG